MNGLVPIGGIIEWFGAILDIPAKWQLCDGTNGTPDLRGKSVKGAGPADPVDGVGGDVDHNHGMIATDHDHDNGGTVAVAGSGPGSAWNAANPSTTDPSAGFTSTISNFSPFHNLAYIQRME